MTSYDKHYQIEDLFGEPYPELIAFFRDYLHKGQVLDLGCGQGRDAITLAKLGYQVTGVDISEVGIQQMLATARADGLPVRGIVADMNTFELDQVYDIVLLDSMIHLLQKNRATEEALLRRIAASLQPGSIIVILMRYNKAKEGQLKAFFQHLDTPWGVLHDSYLEYVYTEKGSDFRSVSTVHFLVMKREVP